MDRPQPRVSRGGVGSRRTGQNGARPPDRPYLVRPDRRAGADRRPRPVPAARPARRRGRTRPSAQLAGGGDARRPARRPEQAVLAEDRGRTPDPGPGQREVRLRSRPAAAAVGHRRGHPGEPGSASGSGRRHGAGDRPLVLPGVRFAGAAGPPRPRPQTGSRSGRRQGTGQAVLRPPRRAACGGRLGAQKSVAPPVATDHRAVHAVQGEGNLGSGIPLGRDVHGVTTGGRSLSCTACWPESRTSP